MGLRGQAIFWRDGTRTDRSDRTRRPRGSARGVADHVDHREDGARVHVVAGVAGDGHVVETIQTNVGVPHGIS